MRRGSSPQILGVLCVAFEPLLTPIWRAVPCLSNREPGPVRLIDIPLWTTPPPAVSELPSLDEASKQWPQAVRVQVQVIFTNIDCVSLWLFCVANSATKEEGIFQAF